MAQVTTKGLDVLKKIEDQAKDAVADQLEDYFTVMANDAINMSPIWSGAYVKSFSFKVDNPSSRGRRIDGANWRFPKKTGSESDREEGRGKLLGDIQTAFADKDDLLENKSYTLRNDANHARFVEYGVQGGAHPPGPKPLNGYQIFNTLRSKYG